MQQPTNIFGVSSTLLFVYGLVSGGVIGATITWLLNEYSQVLRLRREERRAVGRALTDLLNIRHRVLGLKLVTEEIGKVANLTPQEQIIYKQVLDSLLPDLEGLHERYGEAIKVIAGINPVLAFRLSERDYLPSMLKQLRGLILTDESAVTAWHEMESEISSSIESNDIIKDMAWTHGIRTWFRVKRILNKPLEFPDNFRQLVERHGKR
jgi:hypothetical protein